MAKSTKDEAAPAPDLPAQHVSLMETIIAMLRHLIDTLPAAAGLRTLLAQLERQHQAIRDQVMPPPPPPPEEPPPDEAKAA